MTYCILSQYRFRKGHSWFDTVNHDILLAKLNHYDFRAIINDGSSSYLKHRTQRTQVGQHISNQANINCDVPRQGSVLGP